MSLVSPLVTLFTGNPLPALIADKVSATQSLQTPIQNILTALNRGKNYTRIVDNVKVGTYRFSTDFGGVTVKVRTIPSLVLDAYTGFRSDFRRQINAAPSSIDAADIDKGCRTVRAGLTATSFTSRTDIAYAFYRAWRQGRVYADADHSVFDARLYGKRNCNARSCMGGLPGRA